MKIGIKSEIHSCTIEFANVFLQEFFSEEDFEFLRNSLKARVDSQYYVNRNVSNEQFDLMIKQAPAFLVKCKSILINLNEQKIKGIRIKLKELIKI